MEHVDALIRGLKDGGRRAMLSFSGGAGPNIPFPDDIYRVSKTYFSSKDQLLTLAMGAELFNKDFRTHWAMARKLGISIVSHMPVNNVTGTVVTLMERMNVDTVIIAGKIKKYRGKLLEVNTADLNSKIIKSRDYLFEKSGLKKALF